MSTVFTGTVYNTLKSTIGVIATDKNDGNESGLVLNKWMHVKKMDDYWEDDLEVAGPGLASEKPEGAEMATGTILEGYRTRYISRKFAMKLIITEEALSDTKYPKAIDAARRLKKSLFQTADTDSTNLLVRGWNTAYTFGDGLPLFSASHTLPGGGTFSNLMATPLSPSRAAFITARTQIALQPGHNGIVQGYRIKKVVCPVDQEVTWKGILGSSMDPTTGAFNEINVIDKYGVEVVPNHYWQTTTTNYAYMTDAENGPQFRWKKKCSGHDWIDEDQQVMKYSVDARWARGCSDPRGAFGVQA